jgi:polysaccharide biosynthesis protein PslH
MSEPNAALLTKDQPDAQTHVDHRSERSSGQRPAVVIVAPPWPRSGTARVIENQIQYYRHRGFSTLLITVPLHWAYLDTSPIWNELTEGIRDFSADEIFIASLEKRRYNAAKYLTSLRHLFRGTALDWTIDIGRAARLTDGAWQALRSAPVILLNVNHVYTLGFALQLERSLRRRGPRIPIILDTHDIQSNLILERGDVNPWTKKQDSLDRLIRTEIGMLENVDVLVHLSVDDIRFFRERLPLKRHILSMPTIDAKFVSNVNAIPAPAETIDLLFVGQSHAPNLAAMNWFFVEVWPHIAHRRYSLKVVGAVDLFVRQYLPQIYEQFRSCFVGQTPDLAPYYRAARCVIAPMVSGSGISIKTIEALALGKPFVGSSKAYRGMEMVKIKAAGLHAHDDPQDFADAIAWALANEAEAAAKSRTAYLREFSTQAAFASRDVALDLLLKKQHVEV